MRIFLAVLILIFSLQSLTKADDIKDFEIEGMSIGDSLLDFMTESLIRSEINNKDVTVYYEDKYVSISAWEIRNTFKIYDDVGIIFDPNDKKYEIIGLEGTLYFKNKNIETCYKKQKEIAKDIKNSLSLKIKEDIWFVPKNRLKSHQLSIKYIDFNLKEDLSLGSIRTTCYAIKKKSRYNLLYVTLNSSEFDKYLVRRASQ